MRVLVVDDDSDVRESTALLLEMNGYEVKMADSGEHVIRLIMEFHPGAVLLDIGMPGENGYQVAQRIRRLPNGDDLLLIALSGYGGTEELNRSQQAGFDHHLVKPLNFTALRDLLSERVG
jgi:CheY-like chemotaxis protein